MKKILTLLLAICMIACSNNTSIITNGKYKQSYAAYTEEGTFVNSKKNGLVTIYNNDGVKEEVNYVNVVRDGNWTLYYPNGNRENIPYVKGEIKGEGSYYKENKVLSKSIWKYDKKKKVLVQNWDSGDYIELPYINQKITGPFIYYGSEDGFKETGTFINGMQQGKATATWTVGDREDRHYVNGALNGNSFYIWPDGAVENRAYKNNKLNGKATYVSADGNIEERHYKNSVLNGKTLYIWSDGGREEATYVNGKKEGKSILYCPCKDWEERTYVNGMIQGKAFYHNEPSGKIDIRIYKNNKFIETLK